MEKLFTVAGTAVFDGVESFRVATGTVARRTYKLRYHGAEQVHLQTLPEPMTRVQAIAWLQAQQAAQVDPVAAKKADFVARMAAARAAKRAAAAK
jgi:hypothetical protein